MAYEGHIQAARAITARCAVVTLSDTRSEQTDTSGGRIRELLEAEHHGIARYAILPDDPARLTALLDELLSDPSRSYQARMSLLEIPLLELKGGFWMRAGITRSELLKLKIRPALADSLIAQFCIDHKIPLHARDADFRPFAKYAGLELVLHGLVN